MTLTAGTRSQLVPPCAAFEERANPAGDC